jgi:hypothetical protein
VLEVGRNILLPVRDADFNPLLTTAAIIAQQGSSLVVELPAARHPTPGDSVEAFCHAPDGTLHRFSTLVETVEERAATRVRLRILLNPVRIEHRGATRVDVSGRHMAVTVDGRARCRVLDISAGGFAFDAPCRYEPEQTLAVELLGGDLRAGGLAVVRGVRVLGAVYRCGVSVDPDQIALRGLLDALLWRVMRPSPA